MKTFLTIIALAGALFAAPTNNLPLNTFIVWQDSILVDSTETKYTTAAWVDNGAQKALLIEARNDSGAGIGIDSACVDISLMQVFPFNRRTGNQYFVTLNSRANPDSTSGIGNSGAYMLFDSLHINSMDSTCLWARNKAPYKDPNGITSGYLYGDTLKTLMKTKINGGNDSTAISAFTYCRLVPDFTPAIAFKVKGCASNGVRGVGSKWIFRIFQWRETK